MEVQQIEQNLKTFTLSVDEPHLNCIRNGAEITFKAGDLIIVAQTSSPRPGSLVIVQVDDIIRLCRYENIQGNSYLFPPLDIDPSSYRDVIQGQLVDQVRISNWLSIEN